MKEYLRAPFVVPGTDPDSRRDPGIPADPFY